MFRRILIATAACVLFGVTVHSAQAQQPAYGQNWANSTNTQDWNRFYHYPYTYYPHNY